MQNEEDQKLEGFSKISSLTQYEQKLIDSYKKIMKVLSLNSECIEPEKEENDHIGPEFTIEELNKEVTLNWQRMKIAGDLMNNAYKELKSCKKGINEWIRSEVPSYSGEELAKGDNLILDLIEK